MARRKRAEEVPTELVLANEKLGEYRDVLEALEHYASMQICEHKNIWSKEMRAARELLEREK